MGWLKRAPSKSRSAGPFGLRGIALVVLATSVYLSMLASIAALFKGRAPDPWARLLVAFLAILVWAVLLPIYRYWGVRIAVRIHWIGPAVMLLLMLIPLVLLQVNFALLAIALACGVCTLVSFPAAIVILLAAARRE